jgi:hypothetical protein
MAGWEEEVGFWAAFFSLELDFFLLLLIVRKGRVGRNWVSWVASVARIVIVDMRVRIYTPGLGGSDLLVEVVDMVGRRIWKRALCCGKISKKKGRKKSYIHPDLAPPNYVHWFVGPKPNPPTPKKKTDDRARVANTEALIHGRPLLRRRVAPSVGYTPLNVFAI